MAIQYMTKVSRFISLLLFGSFFISVSSSPALSEDDVLISPRHYECISLDGRWITTVTQNYKDLKFIQYVSDAFLGSGWTHEKRCKQISMKFELNERNGNLEFLVPGYRNRMEVVCASKDTRSKNECSDDEVLFTVLPGQNASEAISYLDAYVLKTATPIFSQSPKTVFAVTEDGSTYNVMDINRAIYLLKE
jgi:Circadian oscillating protein COP23